VKHLKASWLIPNAQVSRMFAADDGDGVELLEGTIYNVRADFKNNPYNSISVAWLKREQGTNKWFYADLQEDNLCSPWDLQLSKYILLQNVHPSSLPASLQTGATITAPAVLEYLKTFDFASVFLYKLTQNEEYCEMFPEERDRLDFHVLASRCTRGEYHSSKRGVLGLFEDLELMVANGKQFNDCNRSFQPWRLCDMVEKTVGNLKIALGTRLTNPASSSMPITSSDRKTKPFSSSASHHQIEVGEKKAKPFSRLSQNGKNPHHRAGGSGEADNEDDDDEGESNLLSAMEKESAVAAATAAAQEADGSTTDVDEV
jgi:hypothetical protein